MSAHTPGPWETQPNPRIYGHSFVVPQGYADDVEGMHTICHTSVKDADACLIASAPDLLEAVKRLLVCMDLAGWHGDDSARAGRAAIAKATGASHDLP